MAKTSILSGVAHKVPTDLKMAITLDPKTIVLWKSLTPLSRNEWICWVVSVKKPETREAHIKRVVTELKEGVRRPCCWIGCIHRTDKSLSPSVKHVLNKRLETRT